MKNTSTKGGVFETICLLLILLLSSVAMMAQQVKTYTGIVTDSKQVPLPEANLIIKGTKSVAITDLNENFSIQANDGEVYLK